MTILIPAYEPDNKLIKLINELREVCDYNIVIVDDGSGISFKNIFELAAQNGCTVLTHETNRGKGRALKTGFNYIRENKEAEGVVTADCDGQHLPKDIVKIAQSIKEHRDCIVLGTRRFIGKVPFRSRFGNSITRAVFSFASGSRVYDTQTGLRGFSTDMLKWLCEVPGERFEYEMNMLLEAVPAGYGFYEADINTVYLEKNKSSHFHPLKDSLRVYKPILRFSMSSILSALLDFTLLSVIQFFTSNLFLAVVGARVCSALFNYTLNRLYVFSKFKGASVKKSFPKYFLLAAFIMLANYSVIDIYYSIIGFSLFFAKIFTEVTIFLFSFWSQRKFVFR
ncbi:bifunctional glycosyltransferase family 2/GtrA family protein [Clostridium sp. SYSU_GA19001]|nr:bifunctional glycosyltransferase family 2/GtrA family protein [Clostridium caldaquaticum]MCM8710096.1 bifunctional glycosyltransferase family 2/GtrA family protein [Clostridium caldaquaticum]